MSHHLHPCVTFAVAPEATCLHPHRIQLEEDTLHLPDVDTCTGDDSYSLAGTEGSAKGYVLLLLSSHSARRVTLSAQPSSTDYSPLLVASKSCSLQTPLEDEVRCS